MDRTNPTNKKIAPRAGVLIRVTCAAFFAAFISNAEAQIPPPQRFKVHGPTVIDEKTGLRWQRCSVGLTWAEGNHCVGNVETFSFREAQKIVDFNGPSGIWRMPTKQELETLIDASQEAIKLNPYIFPDASIYRSQYWTCDMVSETNAWYADFSAGGMFYTDGDEDFLEKKWHVRLVHTER